ncbi:MAG: hypothetical protein M3011_12375 [Actinomycetota bacterium]|nr:hypothetical protein [Actinomycetota bacterium]
MTRRTNPVDADVLVHVASDPLVDPEQEWQWLAGLEVSLAEAIASASAGELEGLYLLGEHWVLCAHGPSLDLLLAAVSKVVARWPFPANSYLVHHDGAAGAVERRVTIDGEASSDPGVADKPASSAWRPLSEQGVLAALAASGAA